jgi:hypothetical protein
MSSIPPPGYVMEAERVTRTTWQVTYTAYRERPALCTSNTTARDDAAL